jgi:hypothetical protein
MTISKEQMIQELRAEIECLRAEFLMELEKWDEVRREAAFEGCVPVEHFEEVMEWVESQARYIAENYPSPMPGRRLTVVVDNTTKKKGPALPRQSRQST